MDSGFRKIPSKNYIILGIILFISLLILIYFNTWFSLYRKEIDNKMILDKYLTVINVNEVENYLVENPNSIIYVSALNDDKIRNFERQFKNTLKNKLITRDILYMDLTPYISNDKVMKEFKKKYSLGYADITDVPNIMVFENGELKIIYNISENSYDIKRVSTFLNSIKYNSGDDLSD